VIGILNREPGESRESEEKNEESRKEAPSFPEVPAFLIPKQGFARFVRFAVLLI